MEIIIKRFIIVSLVMITYLKFHFFGIRNPYLLILLENNQMLLKFLFIVLILLLFNRELILYLKNFTIKELLFFSFIPTILLFIINLSLNFILSGSFLIESYSFSTFFILSAFIIGTLYEELIYRFILIDTNWSFKLKLGALFLSSLLFTYAHADVANGSLPDMIQFFIMGIVFSLIYIKTNNILYTINGHILYNSIVLLLSIMTFS